MLILTRRLDESVMIDGAIEVKVLSVRDGHVRLGITAPRDVVVDRSEVYQRKQREWDAVRLAPPTGPG